MKKYKYLGFMIITLAVFSVQGQTVKDQKIIDDWLSRLKVSF